MPDQIASDDPPVASPPDPPTAPRPGVKDPGAGPGWSVRATTPRELKPWERESPTAPPAAPPPPPPAPPPPGGISAAVPTPRFDAPVAPREHEPAPASSFPSTFQLIAVLVVAALVVAGLGAYLLRSRAGNAAPVAVVPAGGAVAVVHDGPAMLAAQSLNGGPAGKRLTLPGSPANMVTTPDGTRAYLLDSTHGQVVPVDLQNGSVGSPIPAGKLPIDEEMSADGHTLFVTDNLGGAVIPIDTATNTPRPAQQLVEGVGAFVPSPTGPTAVISVLNGAGQPGILSFYNPTAGLGPGVAVGRNSPAGLYYSPDGATLWVTEDGVGNLPGAVLPVDVASHAVGAPITVGHGVAAAAMSPDGRLLLVANSIDSTVSAVNLATRAVVATIAVGAAPVAVGFAPDGVTAWVACALDRTLVPITLATDRAGAAITLDGAPADLAVSAGARAWVLFSSSAGNVTFLNGTVRDHPTPVGNAPVLLIAPDSRSAWVANALSDTVQRVDVSGGAAGAPIHVARAPDDLALTPDHKRLLVLSFGDGSHPGSLTAVDTASATAGPALAVGIAPSSLTIAADGRTAYVANHQANTITAIDLRAWSAGTPVALPCSPSQLVITPDGASLFADCADSSEVVPLTTGSNTVGAAIPVADSSALVMGNLGKTIFVAADHVLQEIDVATDKVVLSHPETGNIVSLSPTPDDLTLVAVENTGGALLLLHAATLATTTSVAVGSRPGGLVLNADGSRAFVLDSSTQKLYIVDVGAAKVLATLDVSPDASYVTVPTRRP